MNKLKLIVFDWDGTLADSVSQIVACKQSLARQYGLPLPSEVVVRQVLGRPFEQAMAHCFPTANPMRLHQLSETFHALMQQAVDPARLFPGANVMLHGLKRRGFKLAIATAKDRRELNQALQYHALADLFDATCCGKEYQEKPQPAMLNYLLDYFQVQPMECVMIGDTTTDLLFAANAGVNAVGVTFGAHSQTELAALKPMALIHAWSQLPTLIAH